MNDVPEKLDLASIDIAQERRQELLRLFPEIRTEGGKLDFELATLRLAPEESVNFDTSENLIIEGDNLEVHFKEETFWLDQKRIAELFGVEIHTISYHLREIFASGELDREATVRRIRRVGREGSRAVSRDIDFYNLDAIIAVGYRVNSALATRFRIWATQTLKRRSPAARPTC